MRKSVVVSSVVYLWNYLFLCKVKVMITILHEYVDKDYFVLLSTRYDVTGFNRVALLCLFDNYLLIHKVWCIQNK